MCHISVLQNERGENDFEWTGKAERQNKGRIPGSRRSMLSYIPTSLRLSRRKLECRLVLSQGDLIFCVRDTPQWGWCWLEYLPLDWFGVYLELHPVIKFRCSVRKVWCFSSYIPWDKILHVCLELPPNCYQRMYMWCTACIHLLWLLVCNSDVQRT